MKRLKNKCLFHKHENKQSIRINYKNATGNELNLEYPKRFTEKLQWLKLHYRNQQMRICADKYAVREYVKENGFEHTLNKIYAVYNNPEEIKFDELPDRFVLKTSHSSGWNIICTNKKKLIKNWFWWKKIVNIWLREDYSNYYREWHYKNIQPRIICERYLGDEINGLNDYKFFCFNGSVKLVELDIKRYTNHIQIFYDNNWNHIPLSFQFSDVRIVDVEDNFDHGKHKPHNFEEMIKMSQVLSKGFPHCRVDLYEWEDKIYFGEMTFFHGSGYFRMTPDEYDVKMGEWLTIPEIRDIHEISN
ncbi:MAG: hypothetical protein JXR31_07290 [Prolixibacteraceae bacterium]|nr:hypothetical protein [Prolixibacteraceae bacterium]